MKFTQIPNELKYPPVIRSSLSTIHSEIVSWVMNNFTGTYKQRQEIIDLMNSITYLSLSRDNIPEDWDVHNPLVNAPHVDDDTCRKYLSTLYILEKNIDWDIETSIKIETPIFHTKIDSSKSTYLTPKEDLYIQSPKVPQFDKNSVWVSKEIEGDVFEIYQSLPIVPTKQNEISITTDVTKFTKSDLMKLYPNQIIHTRASCMYESTGDLELDPTLGLILPIQGYTKEQLRTNLIEYPHLYKLLKYVDGEPVNFYKTIEIDEKLYDVSEIWSNLPESANIPYSPDFIKEYVVRRYLLERDYKHIDHKYQMFGSLDPFLTLFMPTSEYESLGYDVEDIARKCVQSRVQYKTTRSPIIRRLADA